MPVFYITYYAKGLKFRAPIGGFEWDYTKDELNDIRRSLIEKTEKKLEAMGYVES